MANRIVQLIATAAILVFAVAAVMGQTSIRNYQTLLKRAL
jgi:hypothetical protein